MKLGSRESRILLVVLLAAQASWLLIFSDGVYAGPDAAGYYTPARLVATEGTPTLRPESPARFIGYHWLDGGDGRFHVRYPPGLPTLLAPAYRLAGPGGVLAVNGLLALAGVLLLFLLARRWVGEPLALVAAAAFATLPVLSEQALLGFSHLATGAVFLGALLAVERWRQRPGATGAFAAGVLLGALPAIRYPAVVLSAAAGAYAIRTVRTEEGRGGLLPLLAGAALPVGALAAYHWIQFGSPLETGYSLSAEDRAFGLEFLVRNLWGYAGTLARNAGAVVLVGTAGMVALLRRRATRPRGALLLGAAGAATALYAAYYWPGTDIRFLLPVLPLWILAAVSLLRMPDSRRRRRLAVAAFLALHLAVAVPDGLSRLGDLSERTGRARLVVDSVRSRVPVGSVIVGPHGLQTLLEPYGEWKLAEWTLLWVGPRPDPATSAPSPTGADGTRRPSPFQPGKADALRAPYEGLDRGSRVRAVLEDLFAWAGDRPVYWIAGAPWIEEVRPLVEGTAELVPAGRIPAPDSGRSREAGPDEFWLPRLPLDVYVVHPSGADQTAVMNQGSSRNVHPGNARE